jgi:hypothetical protein
VAPWGRRARRRRTLPFRSCTISECVYGLRSRQSDSGCYLHVERMLWGPLSRRKDCWMLGRKFWVGMVDGLQTSWSPRLAPGKSDGERIYPFCRVRLTPPLNANIEGTRFNFKFTATRLLRTASLDTLLIQRPKMVSAVSLHLCGSSRLTVMHAARPPRWSRHAQRSNDGLFILYRLDSSYGNILFPTLLSNDTKWCPFK